MSLEHQCVAMLSILSLLQCLGCSGSDNAQRVRAAEAYLGLQGPVTVQDAGVIPDGGSTRVTLKDSLGRTLFLFWDCRMDVLGPGKPHHATWGHLFLGAQPTDEGARHVQPGAAEEQAVCVVLEDWVERNIPKRKRNALRNTDLLELSPTERQQVTILGRVEVLKKRCRPNQRIEPDG